MGFNSAFKGLSWVPAAEEDQDQKLLLLDSANREALLCVSKYC
jgi:hypothetical protein